MMAKVILVTLVATVLSAQNNQLDAQSARDSLRATWRIALPPGYVEQPSFARALPATSASTPSAFGPAWGDVFAGAGYQRNTRPDRPGGDLWRSDGAVVAGFGVGNAAVLGLEVAVTSFSTFRRGVFTRSGVSLKAHRLFSSGWAVAAGSETAFVLGGTGDGGRSNYVVTSRMFYPQRARGAAFSAVGVSLGIGDGRYRSLADVRTNRKSIGVFGAASTRFTESLGAIADWNGQDLTLSASWVPFRCVPLTISPGVTDVTGNADSDPRFILGVGMGLNVREVSARFTECAK